MEAVNFEEMTRANLFEYINREGIKGAKKNDNKTILIKIITDAQKKEAWESAKGDVAIKLNNNIHTSSTGRLEKGVHIVEKRVADNLTQAFTNKVVEVLTPQEVAAYYGLDDGSSN